MEAKLTPKLEARVRNAKAGDVIEVVVELVDRGTETVQRSSRASAIRSIEEAFQRDANPVEAAIRTLGGTVTERLWIDQTVRARVPAPRVRELSRVQGVAALDVPHPLAIG